MTFGELLGSGIRAVGGSAVFRGTLFTGTIVLFIICVLILLLCITFLLRIFFRRHPIIDRMHKTLIYLLTMAGVLALLIAGVIGAMLPIIPGIVFVFIALLLMRRYHRWQWLDRKTAMVTRQIKRTSLGKKYYAWRKRVHLEHLRRREERLRRKQLKIQEKLNKLRSERQEKRNR